MKKIWVSWEHHRRTAELAAALNGVRLFEIVFDSHRLIRYAFLLLKTSWILLRESPRVVIIQSPSLVLALFTVTFGKLIASKIIVDAHNEGIKPFHPKHYNLMPFYRYVQKRADLTIVTNDALASEVRLNCGNPFVLEDKIPEFEELKSIPLKGRRNVVFICTFEKDEPYAEVVRSARMLDPDICIYVTGRHQKAPKSVLEQAPSNVVFTGYLPEKDYADLLFSCDAVMDLTVMDDCLVCGAYEAVALEKPMILSKTEAIMNYFRSGAVYTENHAQAIAASVRSTIGRLESLREEVKGLKRRMRRDWSEKLIELETRLQMMEDRGQMTDDRGQKNSKG